MSRKPVRMSDVPYEKTGTRRRIFSASLRVARSSRTDHTPVQFLAAPVTKSHEFALQGSLTPWTDIISGFSTRIREHHKLGDSHPLAVIGEGI